MSLIFPRHECGLYLQHNPHRDYYGSVENYSESPWMDGSWISEEEYRKAVEKDEIWTLQWYPNTPVVSYHIAASELEILLTRARQIQEEADGSRMPLESPRKPAGEFK